MKRISKTLRRRFSRDQAGQSIVFLAIAFIVLAGFVGLVTDISILFVRYSQLRRTVDAAAIAAAGQIREGSDYGNVAVSARQFVLLHGLEPRSVIVETCETDIHHWRQGTGPFETAHPDDEIDPVTGEKMYPLEDMPSTELCNWRDPRKLVRVTAQVDSPTFFMGLIGRLIGLEEEWENITLEATSLSETAVLDVVLVLDGSKSMADETTKNDFELQPGYVLGGACGDATLADPGSWDPNKFKWGGCCNDPGQGQVVWLEAEGRWQLFTDTGIAPDGQYDPATEKGLRHPTSGPGSFPTETLVEPGLSDLFGYSDLVCQPFRQVKDAARSFTKNLDYIRGDRIAYVTFDRTGKKTIPIGKETDTSEFMISSETIALATLNRKVGININKIGTHPGCYEYQASLEDYDHNPGGLPEGDPGRYDNSAFLAGESIYDNENLYKMWTYQTVAPCLDTNVGGGLKAGSDVLTNVETIRRDAVWVIILLSDGAATATDTVLSVSENEYGYHGFCPWDTFCVWDGDPAENPNSHPHYPVECPINAADMPAGTSGIDKPWCNDNIPETRHQCLLWQDDAENPFTDDPALYDSCVNDYDADDYARDMADFAGLIDVTESDDIPGNFIAMFTIGFGENVAQSGIGSETRTAAPLLRYIADAGDNGVIDHDYWQDWRLEPVGTISYEDQWHLYNELFQEPGECQDVINPREWCGQYYFACSESDTSLACVELANQGKDLDAVFEAIADRLFTRIAR
jgi:hypothetical protein